MEDTNRMTCAHCILIGIGIGACGTVLLSLVASILLMRFCRPNPRFVDVADFQAEHADELSLSRN